MALRRIAQEHADLQRDPLETCSASPAGTDNPLQWIGYITGPPDTPYEQKRFSIAIAFSEDDPMKPFRLTFTTPLSHPNISDEGEVWLAELEEKHWSPVLTVRSILLCLQVLLSNPKPYQHVMNSKAARVHLKNNPQEHDGGSNAAGGDTQSTTHGHVEPTHYDRRIKGKKYGMDVSRPECEQYKNISNEEDKNNFFIANADIIRNE